jgi:hypothetical protein
MAKRKEEQKGKIQVRIANEMECDTIPCMRENFDNVHLQVL